MSDKKDKAAKVKELALAGKFQEIKASYGQSSVIKAKEYIMSKVTILSEAIKKNGHVAEGDKCATEFMLYVTKKYTDSNCDDDIIELANLFSSGKQNESINKENEIDAVIEKANPSTPEVSAPSCKEITVEKIYEGDENSYIQVHDVGKDIMNENFQNENNNRSTEFDSVNHKGQRSSFSHFSENMKKVIKRENPTFSKLDINREVGNRWKSLDTTGKKYWIDFAVKHTEVYSKDNEGTMPLDNLEDNNKLEEKDNVNNDDIAEISNDDVTQMQIVNSDEENDEGNVSKTANKNDKLKKKIVEVSVSNEPIKKATSKWKPQISFSQVHSFKAKDTKQQFQLGNNKLQKIQDNNVDTDTEVVEEVNEGDDIEDKDDTAEGYEEDVEETEFRGEISDQEELSEKDDTSYVRPILKKVPIIKASSSITKKSLHQSVPNLNKKHKIGEKSKKSDKTEKKSSKEKKAAKDPNAPKRPLNAYLLFAKDHRSEIKSDTPSMKISEVTKELGVLWNALTFHEKRKYTDAAEDLKKKYVVEVNNYRRDHPEYDSTKKNSISKSKQHSKKYTEKESMSKKKSHHKPKDKKKASSDAESDDNSFPVEKITKNHDDDDEDEEVDLEDNDQEVDSNSLNQDPIRKTSRATKKRDIINISQMNNKDHDNEIPSTQQSIKKNNKKMKVGHDVDDDGNPATFVQLKGIKQCHLPPALDLLHMKKMPRLKDKFPDISYKVDSQLKLILEPYRLFISSLPCGLLSSQDMENIQRICHFTENVVTVKLTKVESVVFEIQDESIDKNQESVKIYTVELQSEKSSISATFKSNNKTSSKYKILYASPVFSLLTTDTFLISSDLYYESMRAPWLHKDAQVRRLLAIDNNDNTNSDECDNSDVIGEWQEGSIYYIQRDLEENPYNAISIVWLQQEEGSKDWVFDYMQTDCEASPWDLCLSHFVLLENMKPPTLPKVLKVGTLTAVAILNYLKSQDFSYIYMMKVSEIQEYLDMFPNKKDQLDLHVITSYCNKGRYDEDRKGLGIVTLFDDLKRMVKNSKRFNQSNAGFQPYRCADMMEKELLDLAYELGKCHGIKSLLASANEAILLSQEECAEETEEV